MFNIRFCFMRMIALFSCSHALTSHNKWVHDHVIPPRFAFALSQKLACTVNTWFTYLSGHTVISRDTL
jgi:hypothetical protein